MNNDKIIPVILCGGSGTRLWPISRQKTPKQFLKLIGKKSLIQNTVERALRVSKANAGDVVTVTLKDMADSIKSQYDEMNPALNNHILCETEARNTAAAVALAASYVQRNFGDDAILWILPADHHVGDEEALKQSLELAVEAASNNYLVTFGIRPSRPETGYGYIKTGDTLNLNNNVMKIDRFVEKPNAEKAVEFLQSGDFLWNSGMFVFQAVSVLNAYKTHSANILNIVEQSISYNENKLEVDSDIYGKVDKEPFDTAIMEKTDNAAVVPSNPAWSDIGSWESLWEINDKDDNGNVVKGDVILRNCKNSYIDAQNIMVAGIGLENTVIIETMDAVLVGDIREGTALKDIINEMKELKRSELIEPANSQIKNKAA